MKNGQRSSIGGYASWKERARKKERLVDLSCVAGSLILILLLAMWIPDSLAHSEGTMAHSAMTASLIGGSAFSGYIVMGILSSCSASA